ncbi:MAG: UDP-N-acetylglucosamine 2-epimerase (non-hydrolyzing) [Nitrososphaerota archaeon]
MEISIVLGTRPQIIKSALVIHECLRRGLEIEIIHTGQHYEYTLSQVFLEEFNLPQPNVILGVGSGTHAYQTGEIMIRLEKKLIDSSPCIVVIPGDTNSALAGALTSAKIGIPVAHIESGARSYDMKMAEEINRRLIDHVSKILFAPTLNCKINLEKENVLGDIYLVGDTMYDVYLNFGCKIKSREILSELRLAEGKYAVLTIHRAENVDNLTTLRNIFNGLKEAELDIVFPMHPRTRDKLIEYRLGLPRNIHPINPLGYAEMLTLLKHARLLITDSGGLQKEAFWAKIPCITLRDRTEWIETVKMGVNFLVGSDPIKITQALNYVEDSYYRIKTIYNDNPFGDGRASERIVDILEDCVKK